jgi:hypothetical protein
VGVAVPTARLSTGSSGTGAPGGSLAAFTKKLATAEGVSVLPSLACARQ